MTSVALQRIEIVDQVPLLSSQAFQTLAVLMGYGFIFRIEVGGNRYSLLRIKSCALDHQHERNHFITECHKVKVDTTSRYPRESLHSHPPLISIQKLAALDTGCRHFEVPNQILRKRKNGVHTVYSALAVIQRGNLTLVIFLPRWDGNCHRDSQNSAQGLDPAGSICRKPSVLDPVRDGSNQQPQNTGSGDQQAHEDSGLLNQPIFLNSHPSRLHVSGKALSLPATASLVHGAAA